MKTKGRRQTENYRDLRKGEERPKKTLLNMTQALQGRMHPPPDTKNPLAKAIGADKMGEAYARDAIAAKMMRKRKPKTSRNPFKQAK